MIFSSLEFCFLAAGVDPAYRSLAGEPGFGKDHGGDAEEAGGFQRLPHDAQTSKSAGEVSAGDQLQHAADQTSHQQSACLYALRGKDGVCE